MRVPGGSFDDLVDSVLVDEEVLVDGDDTDDGSFGEDLSLDLLFSGGDAEVGDEELLAGGEDLLAVLGLVLAVELETGGGDESLR